MFFVVSLVDHVPLRWYANPENRIFRECLQPTRQGCLHTHVMHRTNTRLVGSGCTDVHKVGKVRHCNDANRAAHAPAINYKITIATILGRTGTNKLWELASADMLRPMAIGHPIT